MVSFDLNARKKIAKHRSDNRLSDIENSTWYQSQRLEDSPGNSKEFTGPTNSPKKPVTAGTSYSAEGRNQTKWIARNRTTGYVRKRQNTRIERMQSNKRNNELASLLKEWNLGSEIGEERNRQITCYRCHKRGHFAWGCPSKSKGSLELSTMQERNNQTSNKFRPTQPFTQSYTERIVINGDYLLVGSNEGTWDSFWYVNSVISGHMTPNRSLFISLKNSNNINREGDHQIGVHGFGEVEVESEEAFFAISYVAYAPSININVLSMKQLIMQGFEIDIKGTTCTITHMCMDRLSLRTKQNEEENQSSETSTNTGQEGLEIEGNIAPLIIENFDDFITFMVLANSDHVCYKNRDLFKKKFDDAIAWFHKMKKGSTISLPPKVAALDVCLFDLYKLVTRSGGYETITRDKEWGEMAMSLGYPDCYEHDFKNLFDEYLLIPQEYYEFGLKRFGRISSIEDQNVGGIASRVFSGKVAPDGGLAGEQDQDGQNFADTRRSDQVQAQVGNKLGSCNLDVEDSGEEEDPSIVEYYSDAGIGISSKEEDDLVIIN